MCIGYGWFVLFPNEFKNLSKHLLSSSVFMTNMTLYRETGYFDLAAEQKPLLHLWSLSVEEQFYFIWPLFLWSLFKLQKINKSQKIKIFNILRYKSTMLCFCLPALFIPKSRYLIIPIFLWSIVQLEKIKNLNISKNTLIILCISISTLFSFFIHLRLSSINPSLQVYFIFSRIWEMSMGALGAYYMLFLQKKSIHKFTVKFGSMFCFLIVISSLLFLSNSHKYFSILILFPVISSLFLMLASHDTFVNKKILSHPLLVFFGLISYPVYLLHWPCISFLKVIHSFPSNYELSLLEKGSIFVFVIFFGYIIYKYLEKPLRKHTSSTIVWALLIPMGLLASVGYTGYRSILKPKVSYLFPNAYRIMNGFEDWQYPTPEMYRITLHDPFLTNDFFYSIGSAQNVILFLGDSHMQQYAPRIDELMKKGKNKKSVVFATRSSTCPIPNVGRSETEMRFVKYAMMYAQQEEIKEVVVSCSWFFYLNGTQKDYLYRSAHNEGNLSQSYILDKAVKDLEIFLTKLVSKGKKVYVIFNIPFGVAFDPKSFFKRDIWGKWKFSWNHVKRSDWMSAHLKERKILHDIAKKSGAKIIYPENFLCDHHVCHVCDAHENPIYMDVSHLCATYVREQVTFLDFLLK
ncbi:hypothetical protein P618_200917 [Holospora obtusa F1]|uniref:SGNH domain-containing protein n=1 Tax=Holospora obtusa F1 TaxID=1399147 RepID=W6TE51_HOLOB|nr:hypothetical protein P618_200917 [Holospora obtusa F1]